VSNVVLLDKVIRHLGSVGNAEPQRRDEELPGNYSTPLPVEDGGDFHVAVYEKNK
jgi:hypothetical protein